MINFNFLIKNIHRKAQRYLVTLEATEALGIKRKIKTGDVIGLDDVVVATSSDFDELIAKLKAEYTFTEPPTVKVIQSNQIVTREKVNLLLT